MWFAAPSVGAWRKSRRACRPDRDIHFIGALRDNPERNGVKAAVNLQRQPTPTYTVQIADEAQTLTCAVVAYRGNPGRARWLAGVPARDRARRTGRGDRDGVHESSHKTP